MANPMNHNSHKIIISAPTISQAQKWLRDVKGIHFWVESEPNEYHGVIMYVVYTLDENRWSYPAIPSEKCYSTYEEALSQGVNAALDILKGK